MTPKLFKASDVCDLAKVQPYVLRSWEKEFPGIGVQKSAEGPRLYRQSDVDQVLRIKQLVFGEGLTVAGARRRLEESGAVAAPPGDTDVAEVLETLGAHARTKIASVRDSLRQLHALLSKGVGEFELRPPMTAAAAGGLGRRSAGREGGKKVAASSKKAAVASALRRKIATKKSAPAKRRRASA
ncbi:MAG: MerR family transcriptional regulator [Vicinamibacterales bacterium]